MTSLAFMFDDVPAPPWMTSTTNCSLSLPLMHVHAGLLDRLGALGVQEPELAVGAGGGHLDGGQAADQVHVGGQRLAGDGEVLHGAEGVDTPVRVGGHIAVPEQIVLGAKFHAGSDAGIGGQSWVSSSGIRVWW